MRKPTLVVGLPVGLPIRLKFGPIKLKFWPRKAKVVAASHYAGLRRPRQVRQLQDLGAMICR